MFFENRKLKVYNLEKQEERWNMLIDFELFYTYKEDELLFELSSNFSYQNMSKSDMEHELKGMLNGIVAEVDNSKKVLGIIGEFFNNYQLFYMELFDYKRICIQIKENFEYIRRFNQ